MEKSAPQLQPSNDGLSPEYIAAALRIALSLTKQANNNDDDCSEDRGLPPPFPISCIDWTDSIEVTLKKSDDSENTGPSQKREDGADENIGGAAAPVPPHLNVAGAKIVCNGHIDESYQVNNTDNELQRIYSLGLVLYQVFSIGQVPLAQELLVVSSPDGEFTPFSSCPGPMNDRGSHSNVTTAHLDNFARTLNVSDEGVHANGHISSTKRPARESETSTIKRRFSSSRSKISSGIVRCDEPIDLLRMQGVPSSICDLIYNMIDCINGSLMGNESYSRMSDVTLDLQLMLHKPSIYLDPLDKDRMLQVGLELDENMPFGRDQEFATLQSAYQRSISGSSELAVITGLSGSGKTMIANRFGDFVTASGGLFVSGKFDQMKGNSDLVIASAFNEYCESLAREENSVQAALVSFKLEAALGKDVYYLTRMIPNLSHVLNGGLDEDESFSYQECIDAQKRIHYLLSLFVDVICDCSEKPMVLFIDDLQWANSASISIINQLLQSSRSRQDTAGKFFFLGSFRIEDSASEIGFNHHPFWSTIASANSYGCTTTTVNLVYLSKDVVSQFVADLLHLSPRLVASLSDIVFHKTKGNPLFIARMLLSLNRKGLLYLSLTRNRTSLVFV